MNLLNTSYAHHVLVRAASLLLNAVVVLPSLSPTGLINLQLCHSDNGSEDRVVTVILQPWYRLKHRQRRLSLNCKHKC